jgi:Anti-sigma factor NepR
MKQRKEKPIPVRPLKERKTEAAFDLWLQRGLHQLFDDVAQEPIPEDLLRLIEEDRKK